MEKLLLLIIPIFLFLFQGQAQQIKISQLPTVSGTNMDSLWLPANQGSTTKKVRGYQLKGTVIDTSGHWVYNLFRRNDSLFYQKAGVNTFITKMDTSAVAPTLQTVTDAGNTTTNALEVDNGAGIDFHSTGLSSTIHLNAAGYGGADKFVVLQNKDGTVALLSDIPAGTATPTLQQVTDAGASTTNAITSTNTISATQLEASSTTPIEFTANGGADYLTLAIAGGAIAGNWTQNLQQASGTIALTSQLTSGTVTSVTGTAPVVVATGTTTPVISMKSFNTTDSGWVKAGGSANKILHGDGTWKDTTAVGASAWSLIGNAGTTAGTNFVGTADSIDLVFKTNGVESGRLDVNNQNTTFGRYTAEQGGSYNVVIGSNAESILGDFNVIIGQNAGTMQTGTGLTAIGQASGNGNTGNLVTSVGTSTGIGNSGSFATLVGGGSGNQQTGDSVTAVGWSSGSGNIGARSTFLGLRAGYKANVINTYRDAIMIGYGAMASANKQLALSDSITQIKATGFSTGAGYVLTDVSGNGLLTLAAAASTLTAGYGISLPSTAIIADTSILINKTGTQTMTNKTLTSPVINVGSDAQGDIYYRNGSGLFTRLAAGTSSQVLHSGTAPSWKDTTAAAGGTVTSVSFTGGLISVANPTTTPAFTVAGTSGGIPYFSSSSTWASSAALAANAIVIGGGAGATPSTTTTGTGVLTALGVNTGSAGAFVVNGGALGTPSSGTLTNATGLPIVAGTTGTLTETRGGTNQTTYTTGDLLYASAANTLSKLPIGTAAQHLIGGTIPAWRDTATSGGGAWLLASGGTLTGTNTITAGTNPIIFSTGVTTGTAATAGIQLAANSLTTGVALDASSSSFTTGALVRLISNSTAANGFSLLNIYSSGANANATRTATGATISMNNTGTTNTNVGLNVSASGATNNYGLIVPAGYVGIGTSTPASSTRLHVVDSSNLTVLFESTGANTYSQFKVKGPVVETTIYSNDAITEGGVGTNSNHKFKIRTNALDRMTISSGGIVGIGTTSPAASSLLDVTSTTGGLLIPRMTPTQYNAIASPANDLLVTNTTSHKLLHYTGAAFVPFLDSLSVLPAPALTATYIGVGNGSNLLDGSSALTWAPSVLTINGDIIVGATGSGIITNSSGTGITKLGDINNYSNGSVLTINDADSLAYINNSTGTLSVGINTATPNSSLHVNGSFATAYVAVDASYTATAADYTINCTNHSPTITLPTAVGIAGRIYVIVSTDVSSTTTINADGSEKFNNVASTPSTITITNFGTKVVQSDGVGWLLISSL